LIHRSCVSAAIAEPRAQRHRDRGKFRRRIGVRQVSADAAAIADLGVGDVRQRLGDQGKRAGQGAVALQRPVARQRSDPGRVRGRTNAGKLG
jgi:hypothetical protein